MRVKVALSLFGAGSFPWLLGVSLVGFALTGALAFHQMLPGICGMLTPGTLVDLTRLSINAVGFSGLLGGWSAMLLAMMPPLVSGTVNHVLASSLPRRRARATVLFLLGYGIGWTAAGLLLIPLAIATILSLHRFALPSMLLFAIFWNCSPWGQIVRNRCHRTMRIGLKGWRADRDCLNQGLSNALWCILSCAPWMISAMVTETWHVTVMVAVTFYLWLDRVLPPARPVWRMPAVAAFLRAARRS